MGQPGMGITEVTRGNGRQGREVRIARAVRIIDSGRRGSQRPDVCQPAKDTGHPHMGESG